MVVDISFNVCGNDGFLEIQCVPTLRHQAVLDLSLLSTGLPTHDVFDQFQKTISLDAFIEGVNDDVRMKKFSDDVLESRRETIPVDLAPTESIQSIEPLERFRNMLGLAGELCD